MPSYTTTEFLDNVKTRAAMPTSSSMFSDARMLNLGDAEMRAFMMPLLIKSREYYLAYDYEVAVTAAGEYQVPTRAVGAKLINAALLDGTSRQELVWLTEDELETSDESPRGIPGVYLKRNSVILVPPTQHGFSTIELTYNIRPGKMVATSAAAQITAINTGTKTLTFASGTIPSTFVNTETFDLIQAEPHFDALGIDLVVTTITSTTMIFSATLPTRLAVGDWVSLANESPIIQCPVELQPLLEQKVATTMARSKGDIEFYKIQKEELDEMMKLTTAVYLPRIEKAGKKLNMRSRIMRRL